MIYALGDAFDDAAKNGNIDKCVDIARSIGVAEKYIERIKYAYYDAEAVGSSTKLSDFGISYMPIERINKNINQLWDRLYG